MGIFGPKRVRCKAGVWTKIISNFGRGYPQEFHVQFVTDDQEEVSGSFVEQRYLWIFPQEPVEGELKREMKFRRDWINGIYSVKVRLLRSGTAIIN